MFKEELEENLGYIENKTKNKFGSLNAKSNKKYGWQYCCSCSIRFYSGSHNLPITPLSNMTEAVEALVTGIRTVQKIKEIGEN
jgi:hypothetical protein